MKYTDSAAHKLTVAAIHTPAGQPVTDVDAVHDANCTHPNCQPTPCGHPGHRFGCSTITLKVG